VLLAGYFLRLWQRNQGALRKACALLSALLLLAYLAAGGLMSGLLQAGWFVHKPQHALALEQYLGLVHGIWRSISGFKMVLICLPALCAVWALVLLARKAGFKKAAALSLAAYFGFWAALDGAILPAAARLLTPKRFADETLPFVGEKAPVYSFRHEFYALNFYLANRLALFDADRYQGGEAFVYLHEKDLPALRALLEPRFGLELLKRFSDPMEWSSNWLILARVHGG
jgi:hypothetical protein